ncbi:MAG: hypothetical protein NTZ42_02965 [Candidatus Gribaldobacteria bacterium]|nr:hypothetical protein [Candidatus Gribaldobacteria bacterium]
MKIVLKEGTTKEEKGQVKREAELRGLNPCDCPDGISIEPGNGNWRILNSDNFSCIAEVIKD